jgi:carboxymethylenebutenolidase
MVTLNAPLPRGTCPIETFGALDNQSAPIVFFFMAAFGPRPALFNIAERLSGEGYRVLMPHLFYEHLPFSPFAPEAVFKGGDERNRMVAMVGALDQGKIDVDIQSLLSFADEQCGTNAPIGAVGYCLGGRHALTVATANPRVVLAASFHGGHLADDNQNSPHTRFKGLRSRIYVGIASEDHSFGSQEEGRLAAALRDGGVDHILETFAGTHHGFVMGDLPSHNPAAAERHWERLSGHMRETFTAGRVV